MTVIDLSSSLRYAAGMFLGVVVCWGSLNLRDVAIAQVTPDGTLSTTVTPTGSNFAIDNGDRVGNNLFHSFSQFSVPTGGSAIFNNAADIQNIFSRVTGGSVSSIDGLIQASGTANLFLLNPSGILFGPNASLNIGGSFIGTTATSIRFADGVEFSAANPTATPLLTLSVPIGLQMGQSPGAITVQGSLLGVRSGQTLSFMGGDLHLQGGVLFAPSGRIEIGSLAEAGSVAIAPNTFAANYSGLQTFGTVDLSQGAILDLSGDGAGSLNLQAGKLSLREESQIIAGTIGNNNGGNIAINADQLILDGGSAISSYTLDGSGGDITLDGSGGDIDLQVRTLQVLNGSSVRSLSFGSGSVGRLNIAAKESIEVSSNNPDISTSIFSTTEGSGKGGDITVKTPDLLIDSGGEIVTATFGTADAGMVTVTTDRLRLDNRGGSDAGGSIVSSSFDGMGNAGQVNVRTRTLQMFNGAYMATDTFGLGNAGYLHIQATESMEMSGASPTNYPTALFSGNGNLNFSSSNSGTILVETPSLIMRDQSYMRAALVGSGDAGNIIIKADTIDMENSALVAENESARTSQAGRLDITANQVRLDNSIITTQTYGEGEANSITVNVQNLQLLNRSIITASTTGSGAAGEIAISTRNTQLNQSIIISQTSSSGNAGTINLVTQILNLDQGSIFSSASRSAGQAGNLNLQAQRTTLRNGSQITTRSTGTGDGGTINLTGESLSLRNNAAINASTASGSGGNLNLNLSGLLYLRDLSLLNAEAGGTGNGGNITLNAPFIVGLGNSDIIANAFQGRGGTIKISTDGIFGLKFRNQLTPDNDITASSQFGINGTVQINLLRVNPTNGLDQLAIDLVDASQQIAQGCAANQGSSFVITGRGGLPSNPMQQVGSDRPWTDTRNLSTYRGEQVTYIPQSSIPAPLVEATNWRRNAKGDVEVYAATEATFLPANTGVTCAKSPASTTFTRP